MQKQRQERIFSNELLELAKKENAEALNTVLKNTREVVKHYFSQVTDHHADIEDLCQDCLIRIFQNLSSVRNNASYCAFCRKVAKNTFINFLCDNKTRQHEILYSLKPPESVSKMDYNHISLIEKKTMLGEIVERMSRKLQYLFWLSLVGDISTEYLATELQVSESTVKRLIAKLRRTIENGIR